MKILVACPLYEGSAEHIFDHLLMLKRNCRVQPFDTLFIFNWAVMNANTAKVPKALEAEKELKPRYYSMIFPMDASSREREGLAYQVIQNYALAHNYDYLIIIEHDVRIAEHGIEKMVQLLEDYNCPVAGYHPYELYKQFDFDEKVGIRMRMRYTQEELEAAPPLFRAYTTWCCIGFPAWMLDKYRFRWDIRNRNHADSFFAYDFGMVSISKEIPYLHIRKPWKDKPLKKI